MNVKNCSHRSMAYMNIINWPYYGAEFGLRVFKHPTLVWVFGLNRVWCRLWKPLLTFWIFKYWKGYRIHTFNHLNHKAPFIGQLTKRQKFWACRLEKSRNVKKNVLLWVAFVEERSFKKKWIPKLLRSLLAYSEVAPILVFLNCLSNFFCFLDCLAEFILLCRC